MTSGQFPLRLATAALASGERRGPELLQERLLPPGAVLQRGGLHFPAAPGTSASSACRLQVGSGGRSAGCCGIIRGQARFLGLLTEAAMAVCWLRPAVTRVFLQSHCWTRLFPPPWARPALCPHCSHAASPRLEKQRTYWQYLRRKILKPPTPPFSHVCRVGDPVLRGVAAPVEPAQIASREVQALIQTLQRVMRRQESVGLSAPQLGVPLQVFVAEFPERLWQENAPSMREARQMSPFPLRVFVNPTMRVLDSRLVSFPEGCESISGFSACVPRYQAVQVSGLNEAGEQTKWQASGWAARILQHEMDHLQGVLYIDKMDSRTFVNVEWDKLYQ